RTTQLVFHPALAAAERARLIALFDSDAAPVEASPFALLTPFRAEQDAEQYRQAILRIQEYIRAGDCYQVNYAQRFSAACDGDAWQAYLALRAACPTPFSGFVPDPEGTNRKSTRLRRSGGRPCRRGRSAGPRARGGRRRQRARAPVGR